MFLFKEQSLYPLGGGDLSLPLGKIIMSNLMLNWQYHQPNEFLFLNLFLCPAGPKLGTCRLRGKTNSSPGPWWGMYKCTLCHWGTWLGQINWWGSLLTSSAGQHGWVDHILPILSVPCLAKLRTIGAPILDKQGTSWGWAGSSSAQTGTGALLYFFWDFEL